MIKSIKNLIVALTFLVGALKVGIIKWSPYITPVVTLAQGYSTQGNNSDNSWSLFETLSPTSSYGNRRNVIQMSTQWYYHMNVRKLFIDTVMKKNFALSNVKIMWVDSSTGEVKTSRLSSFSGAISNPINPGLGLLSSFSGSTQTLKVDTSQMMYTSKAVVALALKMNITDTTGRWAPSGVYDRSITNEIQTLSGSGTNTITLSSGGGSFAIPSQTVQVETDPVWTAASSNYYTKTQGDSRYLQSFTESDPLWTASASSTITNIQTGNWNTAFGWGNHASAGYITSSSSNALTNKSGNISQWTNNSGYLTSFIEVDPVWSAASSNYYTKTQGDVRYLQSFTETDPLFNINFSAKSTTDLTEGTNFYYTAARFNTAFSGKSTTNLTEGTNLYYTSARFTTDFTSKSTSDLSEGTNQYFTTTRARAANSAGTGISYASGVITNTSPDQVITLTAGNNDISITGTYPNFVITPYVPTTFTVSRAINSSTFQVSTTRHADAIYNIGISCTASIGGNASGLVQLQYSIDGGTTWLNASRIKNANTVTLAVALQSVNEQEVVLVVQNIPANARLKFVPTSSGTTTITSILGFETY